MSIKNAVLVAALLASSLSPAGEAAAQASAEAAAQAPAPAQGRWEVRVPGGRFLPTGDQRQALDEAHVTALQVSRVLGSRLALTGTFTWARSRDLGSLDSPKLDVFTSDLGLEARTAKRGVPGRTTYGFFAGVGAGVRSYDHRALPIDATHNLAGYASVGGDVDVRRVGVRLEVRDYVGGFKPLLGTGTSRVGNDLVVTAALRFRRGVATPASN